MATFETCCLKSFYMDTHFIGKPVHLSSVSQPPCHFFFLCPQTTCQRNSHELLLLSQWLHFHGPQDWNTACGSENWTLCSLCEILDPNLDITQCKLTQGSYKFCWNLYSKIFNLVWITQLRSGLYKSAYNTCTKILTMFYISAQQPM